MLKLLLSRKDSAPLSVLCLGAHSDDIEIGCGGTLLYLRSVVQKLKFYSVVFSAAGVRGDEARAAARSFLGDSHTDIVIKDYRDGFLPYCGEQVKEFFERLKTQVNPDLILTHWRGDAHQDHRLVSELTRNTFRDHLILEYEIPKYDGDLGRPNVFVPLELPMCEQKAGLLLDAFGSQHSKPWFDRHTFLGLMRIRGMESNASSGYAEAFYCHKLVL